MRAGKGGEGGLASNREDSAGKGEGGRIGHITSLCSQATTGSRPWHFKSPSYCSFKTSRSACVYRRT